MKFLSGLCLLISIAAFAVDEPTASLTEKEFYETLSLGKTLFQPLAHQHQEILEIYADYDSDMDNAFSKRDGQEVSLTFYGGIKFRPHMNPDVLALSFCHELGHLYGGAPFFDEDLKKSLEGQADYWAVSSGCLLQMLQQLPAPSTLPSDSVEWIDQYCQAHFSNPLPLCERFMIAIERLSRAFHRSATEKEPAFWTPDLSVAPATVRTHPSPQCRMDTFLAAARQQSRPACWYSDHEPLN